MKVDLSLRFTVLGQKFLTNILLTPHLHYQHDNFSALQLCPYRADLDKK
jgi:hypothetical protein